MIFKQLSSRQQIPERILTRSRAEGYEVAPSYRAADLVIVNTCGFIDSALDDSLEAIGEHR